MRGLKHIMRHATKKECKEFGLLKSFRRFGIPIKARCWEPNPNRGVNALHDIELYSRADCSTRSMCKVLNEPYEKIFDRQIELSKQYYINFAHLVIMDEIMRAHGYEYSFVYDDVNLTILSFMLSHLVGRYLLITNDHAVAYVDGTLYDNFNPKNIECGFNAICYKELLGWFEPISL